MRNDTGAKGAGRLRDSRLLWALLSLCVALMIWVYYTSNFGVSETKTLYGVEVAFTGQEAMRDTLNLVVSDQDVTTVNVTLSGSRRDLSGITSDDIKAVVNLSNITMAGYRSMSYTLSYDTSINQASIREGTKSPSTIGLQISKLSTRSIPVTGTFDGTPAEGYIVDAAEMSFDPAAVTFTGPEEELNRIARVQVVVGRDEVSAAFTAVGNYVLLDEDDQPLEFEDVQADVETVSVNVPVSTVKEVALGVTLIDGGGATSDNVVTSIQPSTITVAGDAATLDALNMISLANISLANYLNFEPTTYNIVLPNGVECLSGETSATVSLDFVGLEYGLFTVTNLSFINAPDGYTASVMDANKVVTIRAPEDVFSQIAVNNIRIVADLTGITSTSRVPTTVYVDGFESAGAVGTYPLYIRLEADQ